MKENDIGRVVVDAAIRVHTEQGPGLVESVYEKALAYELETRGLNVKRQVPVSIRYRDVEFDEGYRADLIVEDVVIIELKAVEETRKVHKRQTLTYLKLSGIKLGFLLNFGEAMMKDGITRLLNGNLDS